MFCWLKRVALAGSSRLSTLATGGLVFGLFGVAFVGGWVEQIGSFLESQPAVELGILSSLIFPGEAVWRRAAYLMSTSLIRMLGWPVYFKFRSQPDDGGLCGCVSGCRVFAGSAAILPARFMK